MTDWIPVAEAGPSSGEMLGWAYGCGYEVVRIGGDGKVYAGAFNADWVKFVCSLPAPPALPEEDPPHA